VHQHELKGKPKKLLDSDPARHEVLHEDDAAGLEPGGHVRLVVREFRLVDESKEV